MESTKLLLKPDETIEQPTAERLAWVQSMINRCSYRNWALVIESEGFRQPVVILRFATNNTQAPDQPFIAESAYNVTDLPTTVEAFKAWFIAAVASAEMHEVAERAMFDGELVAPPHSDKFRVWSLGLYDAICEAARNDDDAYLHVLHAATVEAVRLGKVPPEVPAQTGCIDHLQRNIPRRLAEPKPQVLVGAAAS